MNDRLQAPIHLTPPECPRKPVLQQWHGQQLRDDYAWLRAENWQQVLLDPGQLASPIARYLAAENQYCEESLGFTEPLQKSLYTEMRSRMREDESEVPEDDGPAAYYWRYTPGAEQPLLAKVPRGSWRPVWQQGEPEPGYVSELEHVLIDGEKEAIGYEYFEFGDCEVSPDHRLLAWSCDLSGSEFHSLKIREIDTGSDFDYVIEGVEGVTWSTPDVLFYTRLDEHHRASRVYRHVVGSDPSGDLLVMHEQDTRFSLSVGLLRSATKVEITASTDGQDEVWLVDVLDESARPEIVAPRRPGHEYCIDLQGETLFVLTNRDGAVDFKIMTAPLAAPAEANWEELVPHRSGCLLLEFHTYSNYMVWLERQDALCRIRVRRIDGSEIDVAFSEEAYTLDLCPSPEFDSDHLRFSYSSPTTPTEYHELDIDSGERKLLVATTLPGGHDPENYCVRRLFVPSVDGEQVPLTCLSHKSTALDGSAPCLLYGYGAYGASLDAEFSSHRLSLVDRGYIHVTAHVRGGEERGRNWYLSTKGAGKQLSFDDFNASARYLIDQQLVAADKIIAMGASAGGLLVAASVMQSPALYAAVVADVPFVDVLNTMLDESLPLTPGEWEQWGNPIENPDAYAWIKDYSPYDNVINHHYPAMLVVASVSDPRVGYWEPAKWVARLRAQATGNALLALYTHMQAGHFGSSGRFASLRDTARIYAFALAAAGLHNTGN